MDNINEAYDGQEAQIKAVLEEQGVVMLQDALTEEALAELQEAIQQADFKRVDVPDQYRYRQAETPKEIQEFMRGLVKTILGKDIQDVWVQEYGHGDYTLQHADNPHTNIDVLLIDCEAWQQDWRGEITYADDQPLYIPPAPNTLVLVQGKKDVRRFLKRINYHAGKHTFTVISTKTA